MNRPRLLLAEDHAGTTHLLRDLLQPEFNVIADVQDGNSLVEAAQRLSPDLIISDISMPGLDGITAAAAILRRNPVARIIFLTMYDDATLVARGMATGAMGYVLKPSAGDELIPAVCAALRGERFVSASLNLERDDEPE
jgi:DNA-binding NarL/FixJ family response regulator